MPSLAIFRLGGCMLSKLTGGWERVLEKVESNYLVYLIETCKAHQCVVSLGGWAKSIPTILRLETLVVMSGRGGWQPPAHSRIAGISSGRSPGYSPQIILLLQEGWENVSSKGMGLDSDTTSNCGPLSNKSPIDSHNVSFHIRYRLRKCFFTNMRMWNLFSWMANSN